MLTALGKHSLIDLTVKATGDTHIDAHHTVEDVAITIGEALREALGDKRGISRFGDATVPLDEALAQAVVDVSGRPYLVHTGEPPGQEYHLIGGHFTGSLTRHVLESIAHHAGVQHPRPRARRPRPAPHRRGAVQGARPRAAVRGRARPAGRRASRRPRARCDGRRRPARRLRGPRRPLVAARRPAPRTRRSSLVHHAGGRAAPLAATCAIAKVEVDVVPTSIGAIAVLRDPRAAADGCRGDLEAAAARSRSCCSSGARGRSPRRAGSAGSATATCPPGSCSPTRPPSWRTCCSGRCRRASVEGVVTSVGMSRWQALRMIASSAKRK